MLLIDTSIWIDHFRKQNARLSTALIRGDALMHAFVLGELALGHEQRFAEIFKDLMDLPYAKIASPNEVLRLISRQALAGSGIGYVDAHLVCLRSTDARCSPLDAGQETKGGGRSTINLCRDGVSID